MTAEKRPTLSYFLDFVPCDRCRISYAASFGTNEISKNLRMYAVSELEKFDLITVREDNAVEMLKKFGIKALPVCDPTLLLSQDDYSNIIAAANKPKKVSVFNYMLRRGRDSTDKTDEYIVKRVFNGRSNLGKCIVKPEEWVYLIKHCDFVVTDSFHGTVFAILFHRPFIAINDVNCSMNARISTLLYNLGLKDRMIEVYNEDTINKIIDSKIDWDQVDTKRDNWAKISSNLLVEAINGSIDK